MAKFKPKSNVVIDAVPITKTMEIKTKEGTMTGNPGDWLITGTEGEKYPCKDSVFRTKYDPVDNEGEFLLGQNSKTVPIESKLVDRTGEELPDFVKPR
jgi:hypothetical protein